MSDQIKHECGIAFIRLLKPLQFYIDKYGTPLYGLNKLYVLMEKQKNRGQDGAGVVALKLNMPPGQKYFNRVRSDNQSAITKIFKDIHLKFNGVKKKKFNDGTWLKQNISYTGEVLLGHLRYGTHGKNAVEFCHPFLRKNNWITRNLIMAGNFNMTNTNELFDQLVDLGQHPKEESDTVTVLEKVGHFLDEEVQVLFNKFKDQGCDSREITAKIIDNLEPHNFLKRAARDFDGGYVMCGIVGHGDAFILRDPNGIRPAYYYKDDEIVMAASERPAIQTAANVHLNEVKELTRGAALIIKKNGLVEERAILPKAVNKACSFERIYFSRGNDYDIYRERKQLGYLMAPSVLKAVNYNVEETVFSFIPNTAETAFYGLVNGLEDSIDERKVNELVNATNETQVKKILSNKIRVDKIAIKDAKLRTFIAQDETRNKMVAHVYDVTYGIVKNDVDTLVVIDDSIVRGTTLKESIISNLDRLRPKKIIVLSTAPQIRYPDCYGIDMSKMGDFIAFKAVLYLLEKQGKSNVLTSIYEDCIEENKKAKPANKVKQLYETASTNEISAAIAQLVTAPQIKAEVQVIYQSIEQLHQACPKHLGDWYFTGNYPTPGGNKVANQAFINFMEGKGNKRAY